MSANKPSLIEIHVELFELFCADRKTKQTYKLKRNSYNEVVGNVVVAVLSLFYFLHCSCTAVAAAEVEIVGKTHVTNSLQSSQQMMRSVVTVRLIGLLVMTPNQLCPPNCLHIIKLQPTFLQSRHKLAVCRHQGLQRNCNRKLSHA